MSVRLTRRPVLALVLFLVGAAAVFVAAGPLSALVLGPLGLAPDSAAAAFVFPAWICLLLLALTWGALRLEGRGLGALGLAFTRRRTAEFGAGFVVSAALFAAVAAVRAASVGAAWTFDPVAGGWAALTGLPLAFVRLFPEELVFRGYAFRKAEASWGPAVALVVSAVAFGAVHLVGQDVWGMGAAWRFLTPMLGGLLFGAAALWTRGLALPTGLHFGANWINASVLGLGFAEGGALWSAPLTDAQVQALTAPDLGPNLPYLAALALLAAGLAAWYRRPRTALA